MILVLAIAGALAATPVEPDSAGRQTVTLYGSFDRWVIDAPWGTVQTEVRGVPWARLGDDPMRLLNLSKREARETVRTWAFTAHGETYVNNDAPWPGREERYGRLQRFGEFGVVQGLQCLRTAPEFVPTTRSGQSVRVPLSDASPDVECTPTVTRLDLKTGDVVIVTPRRLRKWLADTPELAAEYRAFFKENASVARSPAVTRAYLIDWLETVEHR